MFSLHSIYRVLWPIAVASVCTLASASAQQNALPSGASSGEQQISWWVVGTGGVLDAAANDRQFSATIGQGAIADAGDGFDAASFGFWLPGSSHATLDVPAPREAIVAGDVIAAYPDPFTSSTTITYRLRSLGYVRVTIRDLRGVAVRSFDPVVQDAGAYAIEWDGHTDGGADLPSGSYLFIVEASGDNATVMVAHGIMHRLR